MHFDLISNNSKTLITFLTGWGCDSEQFRFMLGDKNYDILICYDYSNLEFDFDFSKYETHYLITFSAGVLTAGLIKHKLPEFKKKIAINGNPLSYHKYFGIRKEIADVFSGITKENTLDFRKKYLIYDDNEFRLFNKYTSHRTFENCKEELKSLVSYSGNNDIMQYNLAILSQNDKIFNPKHQLEYWNDKNYQHNCRVIELENSAHFPFFRLNNYEQILEL